MYINLKSYYPDDGKLTVGKEYTAFEKDGQIILHINNEYFPLDKTQADSFEKYICRLELTRLEKEYTRGTMPFLKWELEYDGFSSTGENTVPKKIARLMDIFHLFTQDFPVVADAVHQAVLFATQAHKGQVRKGSDIPYITHPLEVAQILTEMGAGTDLKIAGILHDVAEDTAHFLEEIENLFGKEVARLVASHTEDKTKCWFERKQSAIDRVKTGDRQVAMLIMADKISNLKSMLADYLAVGEKMWDRFSSTKEMQSAHNNRLIGALHWLSAEKNISPAYTQMVNMYEELYVDFYFDMTADCLYYDKCAVGKGVFSRSKMQWETSESIPADAVKITRNKANRIITLWQEMGTI